MKLGIVGHEEAKFTKATEKAALDWIDTLVTRDVTEIVSGRCPLGGIDSWAAQYAIMRGLGLVEFPPKKLQWNGGYKERNIQIAEYSDKVVCIVVKDYPPNYGGMQIGYMGGKGCYHCKTRAHVKSGGCWTAHYAGKLGKPFEIIEI